LPTASSIPSPSGSFCRRRDDDLRPGLRSFSVGRYTIIYHVEGDDVLILHVIAADRDIEPLL
jgi:plasmid stabilization system protein ParE